MSPKNRGNEGVFLSDQRFITIFFFLPFLVFFGAELAGTAWLEVACDMGAWVEVGSACESGTRISREAVADLSENFLSGETAQPLDVVSPSTKAWRSGRA